MYGLRHLYVLKVTAALDVNWIVGSEDIPS
jgi:hypothetical protein